MNWGRVVAVADLARGRTDAFTDGDWIETEHITTSGNRLLQTGNIGIGRLRNEGTRRYISDPSFAQLRCTEVRPGDILICRLADPAGRACVVPDIGERRMLTSVDVVIFRPDAGDADRRFLVALFSTPHWFQTVSDRSGGTTRTRIARSELGRIEIRLPSRAEQTRIADVLGDADHLIEDLERLIIKKEAIKQGLMQELLTGRTRLPGFDAEWNTRPLRDVVLAIQDGTHFSPAPGGTDRKYITSRNIGRGHMRLDVVQTISETEHRRIYRSCPVKPGDLLLTKDGANTGNAAINRFEEEISLLSSVAFIRADPQLATEQFLLQCLLSEDGRKQIGDAMAGNAITRLTLAKIKLLRVPVPPLNEQHAISNVLRDLDSQVAAIRALLTKACEVKQGLMQQLLTGRTRLRAPTKELTP
jgi:hypothetical protein